MRTLVLALALLLPLAGCLEHRADPPPVSVSGTVPVAEPKPKPEPQPQPVTRSIPLAFEGKIPAYAQACVWSPLTAACPYTPMGDFSRLVDEPALPGAPSSGVVAATWSAATPAQETMLLAAYSYDANGGFASFGAIQGKSPLKLTMASIAVPPGQTFVIGLFPQEQDGWLPVGVGGWAKANPVDQPYALRGHLVVG